MKEKLYTLGAITGWDNQFYIFNPRKLINGEHAVYVTCSDGDIFDDFIFHTDAVVAIEARVGLIVDVQNKTIIGTVQ